MRLSFYAIIFCFLFLMYCFCSAAVSIMSRPPHCRGFTITLRRATPDGTPNEWSARRTVRYLHHTQETQDTNIHTLSRIRTLDPSNTATSDPHLKPHCHWDRPPDVTARHFLLCRFIAIGDSQLIRKISADCEINIFRVHNISSLDHVISQINPIYMLFQSNLLFCLHLSSISIHSSVSTPTITYPERH
jgi:hypothetical protein